MVTLLAQNNSVIAIDIVQEKVEMINERKSPICDKAIEKAFENQELDLVATIDAHSAYMHAEYVILATPTNYDRELNFLDTSAVEPVINEALLVNPAANIIIKSIIPVGFTAGIRPKKCTNIYFSPEFLRGSVK